MAARPVIQPDRTAIVAGAGIAGLAVSLQLARAGMPVICLEGTGRPAIAVGESLDWSAPDLLSELGISPEYLVERGFATRKKHVILRLADGSERHYLPGEWLGRPPYNVRLDTLHVDRGALDAELRAHAERAGVRFVAHRVIDVVHSSGRVQAVIAEDGSTYAGDWFLDAGGGSARVFARSFALASREYGPAKVAMWQHVETGSFVEGTTLYGATTPDGYMEWVWQIPIRPGIVSLGCVFTADQVKQMRQQGMTPGAIYRTRLRQFDALRPFAEASSPTEPHVTSFRCRVQEQPSGENWFLVGEAAAMVDPMTSNGVTAALRHAAEASRLILRYQARGRVPWHARAAYNWRLRGMAAFFNTGIERVIYERPIRGRLGALRSGDAYTIPAWLANLLYTRLAPRTLLGSGCFALALASLRACANTASWCCARGLTAGVLPAESL